MKDPHETIAITISRDADYHTQRNNKLYPGSSCNTTAMIMALKTNKIEFESPQNTQEEDYLSSILDSNEAHNVMKNRFPWAVAEGRPAREVHGMLEWAVNEKLVGRPVVTFTTLASMAEILFNLTQGLASVMTGRFTASGHVVAVVGFHTEQRNILESGSPGEIDTSKVVSVVVDDSFGDFHSGYKNPQGNDIEFPYEEFNSITRSYGDERKKWAHLFRR